jgi:hypothetical protein
MKTTLIRLFVFCLILNLLINNCQSQNESKDEYKYFFDDKGFVSNVPLNQINSKAFRHFMKNFAAVTEEKWIIMPTGIVVTFTYDSVFCKIVYDKYGLFLYSYKYYEDNRCSSELKKMVLKIYPSYAIKNVVELFDGQKIAYGLKVSNDKITRTLELKNGEMKLLNEFQNQ